MANYNTKLSNILYHWQLSMAPFHFCETCLLHIKPFVVNKSAIIPFLGGACLVDCGPAALQISSEALWLCSSTTCENTKKANDTCIHSFFLVYFWLNSSTRENSILSRFLSVTAVVPGQLESRSTMTRMRCPCSVAWEKRRASEKAVASR